jgi:hypothetical protein
MVLQSLFKPDVRSIPNSLGYLCLHLHFYQPPREDPFTGVIAREPTGDHHHDFNEKIFAECYRKLAQAYTFRYISFNIGPTLARWLKISHPNVWQVIRENERFFLSLSFGLFGFSSGFILQSVPDRNRTCALGSGVRFSLSIPSNHCLLRAL